MIQNQTADAEPTADVERRRATRWLAGALLLPLLLAACKTTGEGPPPTPRLERWPPGGH